MEKGLVVVVFLVKTHNLDTDDQMQIWSDGYDSNWLL